MLDVRCPPGATLRVSQRQIGDVWFRRVDVVDGRDTFFARDRRIIASYTVQLSLPFTVNGRPFSTTTLKPDEPKPDEESEE